MRIRNRIKLMIATENHYYNRKGAISVLIGITAAMLVFNLVFNTSYCFGVLQSENNLAFFRNSAYLLFAYILLFILYRVTLRYAGIRYSLIMFFTALSFLACTVSGYILLRAAFCWSLNKLIENPLGFEPILRRAYSDSLRFLAYIAVFYLVVSLIPSIRRRPFLLGRFWVFNLIAPLSVLGLLASVIVFAPEETSVEYARLASFAYLTCMLWLSFRYLLKTLYYFVLLPSERRLKLDDIPKRRFFFSKSSPLPEDRLSPSVQTDRPGPVDVRIMPAGSPSGIARDKRTTDSRPGMRTLPALDAPEPQPAELLSVKRGILSFAFKIVELEEPPSESKKKEIKATAVTRTGELSSTPENGTEKTAATTIEAGKPVTSKPLLRFSFKIEETD